jgi:hypothetical protein
LEGSNGPRIRARVDGSGVPARRDVAQGARVRAVPVAATPARLSDAVGGNIAKGRSVFDMPVLGSGAQLRKVPIAGSQARAVAPPALGQQADQSAVERVIQRELPPVGLSKNEASDIAAALAAALGTAERAMAEGIACGSLTDASLADARAIRDYLRRFASVARPDEKTERLSSSDFALVDEVLACQETHRQVTEARQGRGAMLLAGGLIVGTIILIVAS